MAEGPPGVLELTFPSQRHSPDPECDLQARRRRFATLTAIAGVTADDVEISDALALLTPVRLAAAG